METDLGNIMVCVGGEHHAAVCIVSLKKVLTVPAFD